VGFYGGFRNIQLSGDLTSGVVPANVGGNLFLARRELKEQKEKVTGMEGMKGIRKKIR